MVCEQVIRRQDHRRRWPAVARPSPQRYFTPTPSRSRAPVADHWGNGKWWAWAAMAAPWPLIVSPLTYIDHLTSQPGLRPAARCAAEAPGPPDKAGSGAS